MYKGFERPRYVTLVPMSTTIINLIDAEIARLQQARAAITGAVAKKRPGRPKSVSTPTATKPKQKRGLSPEGRARIVAALKARWAAKKKAAK